jgi:hypothetical protein
MELVTMNTRKLLVTYDESKPTSGIGDFLAVVFEGTTPVFLGLKSRRAYKLGRMVFVGKEIAAKDIFAKLVDSGYKIENVDQTLKNLAAYVRQLESFKIGNVVTITPKNGEPGFELVKVGEMPKSESRRLP